MYLSVNHVLNDAYFALAKTPYVIPVMNRMFKPGGGKGEPRTWDDYAGQAGMVFAVLRDTLNVSDRALLDAWKITPETLDLFKRKVVAIQRIAAEVADELGIDRRYTFVVVAQYSGLVAQRSEDWWAEKLGKSTRTLRRLRNGTDRHMGIHGALDRRKDRIYSRLGVRFRALGWLQDVA